MTGCSVKGCRNSTVKGYVMKRFPRDPARRSAWALNVKREGWTPTNASCLCEVHFDDSQWEQQEWPGTPKLRRTAVPTLFCNCTYGKKRGKCVGVFQDANARVMTEHSYGSVQGTDNISTPNSPVQRRCDRRGDHQYAISAEEEDKKKVITNDECKKETPSHDISCPLYGRGKRKHTPSMDNNNNGDKNNDSCTNSEINAKTAGLVTEPPKEQTHFHNYSEQNKGLVKDEVSSLKVDTTVTISSHADFMTPLRPQILLLIPEQTNVEPETTVLNAANATFNNNVRTQYSSSIITKADSTTAAGTSKTPGMSNYFQLLPNSSKKSACKKETVEVAKVKAAERVLARQARLVKQVATLERQHLQQKRTHQLEMDQLLKKFHELEEKFELTKNILRSFVGDDQLTVCVTDNSRGVVWSKKTIQKALQLRSSCGLVGYNAISKLLIPLPSDRTLKRWNQRSKAHEGIFVEVPKGTLDE